MRRRRKMSLLKPILLTWMRNLNKKKRKNGHPYTKILLISKQQKGWKKEFHKNTIRIEWRGKKGT